MNDLRRALSQHDIMLLQVIAQGWGVDTTGLSKRQLAEQLAGHVLAVDWDSEFFDLTGNEQQALNASLVAGDSDIEPASQEQYGQAPAAAL